MPDRILDLATKMSDMATLRVAEIQAVTKATKFLALNALIEANRAGDAGKGFAVVAHEVNGISERVTGIASELRALFTQEVGDLQRTAQLVRGSRLSDLASYVIELIDRNLYERSCDVRWWATDSAVVQCCSRATEKTVRDFASRRLGVILDSYTVYLDLWIAAPDGTILANGRPGKYPVRGQSVADQPWFRKAMATTEGSDYIAMDIERNPLLGNRQTATYATAVRENGDEKGAIIGALGIFFDWENQAQAAVSSVRLTDEEKDRTRVLLVDRQHNIIASSDGQGILQQQYPLHISTHHGNTTARGSYMREDGSLVGYSLTPGYETYEGLGWYGVVEQAPYRLYGHG